MRKIQCLSILDNADLSGPQGAAVQEEALLLGEEDGAVLLSWLRCHKYGLVDIGIEFLAGLGGVEALETVLLQSVNENAVSHLDALMQGDQVLVVALELLGGNGGEGAVEVVDGLDEIAGEALDGKVLGGLCLARCALLEVAEVGD
jgi:hypothetical protein